MPAIELREITKSFSNGVKALQGVSFEVRAGEVFGLLGPNGAGKTTAVRILATLSSATSGTAWVAGFDVVTQPEEVRRRIAYVAQTTALDLLATAKENLLFHGRLHGLIGSRLRTRVEELIELFQLGDVANRRAQTLSGGMKRRLDLATGILHLPKILFLDEPTSGLDPANRYQLWDHIRSLAQEEGAAVLLTTHHMDEADALASRVAILDQGRIVTEGTPAKLKSELEGDVVTIEVASAAKVDEAQKLLQSLDGITRVIADSTALFALVPNGSTLVPRIVDALRSQDIPLEKISLSEPTLDEVYLSATGRKYRPGVARPRFFWS